MVVAIVLPGDEADLVGPFSGRHGTDAHRYAVSWIGADLFLSVWWREYILPSTTA